MPYVSDLLTAAAASVTGTPTPTRTWQWLRNGIAISGATSATYTVDPADEGSQISVRQIETNFVGADTATSVATSAVLAFDPIALFASGEEGAWYDPSDLSTMYQDALGTTPVTAAGQPVGLILDKSKGLQLGNELLLNTTLDNATSWTLPTDGSVSGNALHFNGTTTYNQTFVGITNGLAVGKLYNVTFEIFDHVSGPVSILMSNGLGAQVNFGSGNGIRSAIVNATSIQSLYIRAGEIGSTFSVRNISVRELPGNHATQSTSAARPVLQTGGSPATWWLDNDLVDDRMVATMPAVTGTAVIATAEGTAAYGVSIAAGSWALLTNSPSVLYTFQKDLYGTVVRDGAMSAGEVTATYDYFDGKGAGATGTGAYAGVTNFSSYWRNAAWITEFPLIDASQGTNFNAAWLGCNSLTSFPLIDTSQGTSFSSAWYNCNSLTGFPLINTSQGTTFQSAWQNCNSLTSFPAINTSAATSFQAAWSGCTSLTSFPANVFDSTPCTNFINAFVSCALTQTSVDNILVSIEAAGTSNGTLNMTGGTSATPGAAGLAAVTALQGRGWTVTHN